MADAAAVAVAAPLELVQQPQRPKRNRTPSNRPTVKKLQTVNARLLEEIAGLKSELIAREQELQRAETRIDKLLSRN